MVELLDDGRETSARQVEEAKAFLKLGGLGLGVTGVDGVVPDFPAEKGSESRTFASGRAIVGEESIPLDNGPKLVRVENVVESTHFYASF